MTHIFLQVTGLLEKASCFTILLKILQIIMQIIIIKWLKYQQINSKKKL